MLTDCVPHFGHVLDFELRSSAHATLFGDFEVHLPCCSSRHAWKPAAPTRSSHCGCTARQETPQSYQSNAVSERAWLSEQFHPQGRAAIMSWEMQQSCARFVEGCCFPCEPQQFLATRPSRLEATASVPASALPSQLGCGHKSRTLSCGWCCLQHCACKCSWSVVALSLVQCEWVGGVPLARATMFQLHTRG